jgi:hypothetical protein
METETTSTPAVAPSTEGVAPVVEGAVGTAPKTYTETDWNTRQSSWDKQMAKVTAQFDEKIKTLESRVNATDAAKRDADETSFLKKIEDAGGDTQWAKSVLQIQREAEQAKADAARLVDSVSGEAKQIAAVKMAKAHNLPEDSISELLESESPTDMENKALKMEIAAKEQADNPALVTETPVTEVTGAEAKNPFDALKAILQSKQN